MALAIKFDGMVNGFGALPNKLGIIAEFIQIPAKAAIKYGSPAELVGEIETSPRPFFR